MQASSPFPNSSKTDQIAPDHDTTTTMLQSGDMVLMLEYSVQFCQISHLSPQWSSGSSSWSLEKCKQAGMCFLESSQQTHNIVVFFFFYFLFFLVDIFRDIDSIPTLECSVSSGLVCLHTAFGSNLQFLGKQKLSQFLGKLQSFGKSFKCQLFSH